MYWTLDKKLSLFILLLGAVMMCCWIFGQATLYKLYPTIFIQVFNSSLAFTLLGITLLLPDKKIFLKLQTLAGLFLMSLGLVIIVQSFLERSLGVDQLLVKVVIDLPVENPGRMSRQTAICFVLAGIFLCLFQQVNTRKKQYIAFLLIIIIFIFGLIGLAGDLFNLNIIYDWRRYGRMAPHTAIGHMVLSIALYAKLYYRARLYDPYFPDNKMVNNCLIISLVTFFWLGGLVFLIVLINIHKFT